MTRMRSPKRFPWQDENDGSLSPGGAVMLISIAILAAGAFGFWFQDMYANGYGIFSSPAKVR